MQVALRKWDPISPKGRYSIANSTSRVNIWHGAVRSSKSFCSLLRWLEYSASAPPGKMAMIGRTGTTVKRNIVEPIQEILGEDNVQYNEHRGEVEMLGRKFWCLGADKSDSIAKIQGTTIAGAYGDEVTIWTKGFWKMLNTRLSVPGSKAFLTCNPDSPFHPIKREWINRAGELNLSEFHFELSDNYSLTTEYVEELKKSYSGLFYKRFILGQWVQAEGAIYDMFDSDRHIVKKVDYDEWTIQKYMVSSDYGASNPTCFLLFGIGRHKRTGVKNIFVLDEYYFSSKDSGKQKSSSEYAKDLLEFIRRSKKEAVINGQDWLFDACYVDPSAETFKIDLRRLRIPVRNATNDVFDGIMCVSNFLSSDILVIDSRCNRLQDEIVSYVWDEKSQEKGEDKPLKENDHVMDALRYGCFAIRERYFRGELVKSGNYVTGNLGA